MEKEMELAESEIDAGTSGTVTELAPVDQAVIWESLAKNAERMIEAKKKIWKAVLTIAKPGDWTVFESDKSGTAKAELGAAGALRIASMIGISFSNWSRERVTGEDEKGQWFRWDMECDAGVGGRSIRVYGRAGSRDRFFGKAHGELKELSDVNEGDVKMAAWRGAQKEGVKALLGLHHIPPAELEAAGVKMESAGGYKFRSDEAKAAAASVVTVAIESARVAKTGKKSNGQEWTLYVVKDAEGGEYATFSKTVFESAQKAIAGKKPVQIQYETGADGRKNLTAVMGGTDVVPGNPA